MEGRREPIEVGFRSFAGKLLHWVLGLLGICELHRQRAIKNMLEATENTSWWFLLRRGSMTT